MNSLIHRDKESGLVVEYIGVQPNEISAFQDMVNQKGLAGIIKNITNRWFLSRAERQAIKELHLTITKQVGQGYSAIVQMQIDHKLQKMRNAIKLENLRDLTRLFTSLHETMEKLDVMTHKMLLHKAQSAHYAIEEARKYTNVPFAEELILDYSKRSMSKLKESMLALESHMLDELHSSQQHYVGAGTIQEGAGNVQLQNFIDELEGWG